MMAQAARFSEIAFIIPAGIVIGYLLGALLNRWFHARWLVVCGVIVGVIAGFAEMIRRAVTLSR
jgi:ATP synthase protein I